MLTYRLAQIEDIPRIAALEQQCFDYPHNPEQLRAMLAPGYMLWLAELETQDETEDQTKSEAGDRAANTSGTASENKILCGYVIARAVLDEADLLLIAVAPDKQRQGVARGLYQQLHKSLQEQGVRQLFLEVRRSNRAAISLYQSLGFEEVAVRKDYYPTLVGLREDALIFKLIW